MNKSGVELAQILATGTMVVGALGIGALSAQDHSRLNWGYTGAVGPAHWGSLDPTFAACSRGSEQSPIDLVHPQPHRRPDIEFDYGPRSAEILNNGHTIQVNLAPGSGIVVDAIRYELVQFHFHHASEHTVAGARYPLEMHLVHQSEDGALAVVGVLHREGARNEALAPTWALLPAAPTAAVPVPGALDLQALLPEPPHGLALPGFAHYAALHGGRVLDRDDRTGHALGEADCRVQRHPRRQLPAGAATERSCRNQQSRRALNPDTRCPISGRRPDSPPGEGPVPAHTSCV